MGDEDDIRSGKEGRRVGGERDGVGELVVRGKFRE